MIAPFEGRYRYVGYDVIYAVRLALRKANAAGGVGGYSVELVAFDDGADLAMAAEQARKLAADPEVAAAIGHFREGTTAAALNTYADASIPVVAPAVLDPSLTSRQEIGTCRLGPPADVVASALLRHVGGLGHEQVALVTDGGPLGTALQRDAGRLSMAADAPRVWPVVSPEDTDWLEEVRASGVEAILCDADAVTTGEIMAALREAGWEGALLGGPELAAPDFAAVAGEAAEGAVFVTPWPFPADVSGGLDFVEDYRTVSNGVPPGPLALPAYEATQVLLEALKQDITAHGEPTREGVAAALAAVGRDGLLGRIAFDDGRSWSDAPLYWYGIGADGTARPMGED